MVIECCRQFQLLSLAIFTLFSPKVDNSNLQIAVFFSWLPALNENADVERWTHFKSVSDSLAGSYFTYLHCLHYVHNTLFAYRYMYQHDYIATNITFTFHKNSDLSYMLHFTCLHCFLKLPSYM